MNLTVDFILCFLFGYLGIHKFYEGKKQSGFIYLFTFGLFGIGWIIDTIKLISKLLKSNKKQDYMNNSIESLCGNNDNDYINKTVTVIDENNQEIQVKQFCQRIVEDDLVLLSNTIYDKNKKIYHKYLDCYEDWPLSADFNFNKWIIKDLKNLEGYNKCSRCTERDYRKNHPNAKITGYDFHYYYEDLVK